MRRKQIVFVVVAFALLISSVLAIETPKNARGFRPDEIYHFGSIDSVNLFNGNVIVSLPIGQHYDVTSRFGYQLTLSYNSNIWDVTNEFYGHYDGVCDPNNGVVTYVPNLRSNAGAGWSLGYGRLFPACYQANEVFAPLYESPDGGAHTFGAAPPGSVFNGNYNGPVYTYDNSHLRLRNSSSNAGGSAYLDFPDGTTYAYSKRGAPAQCEEWPLESMTDSFGNVTQVSWSADYLTETLIDPYGRKTVIHYALAAPNDVYYSVVDHVDVPAFDSNIVHGDTTIFSTYQFHYDYPTVQVNFAAGSPGCSGAFFVAPVLTSIDQPDGSTFTMFHYPANVEMQKLTLPTGGSITWNMEPWQIPGDTCKPENFLEGLRERIFYDPFTRVTETWNYQSVLDLGPYDNIGFCPTDVVSVPPVINQVPKEQKRTIVTSPKGDTTVHYFSAYQGTGGMIYRPPGDPDLSENGFSYTEFGLPLTHLQPRAGLNLFLSTREYDCHGGPCNLSSPDRSTYVQYQSHAFYNVSGPPTSQDALPKRSRTYFENDTQVESGPDCINPPPSTAYVDTAEDDYDGYGHYRQTTTSGNFGPCRAIQSRTVTTNYNGVEAEVGQPRTDVPPVLTIEQVKPGSGTWDSNFVPYAVEEPWILGTYTSITREEGNRKSKQLFFFNRADGFLKRVRVRRGLDNGFGVFVDSGSDTHDLATEFTKTVPTNDPQQSGGRLIQPAGEVASEMRYGGDAFPLASCGSGTCTGQYALQNFPLTTGMGRNLTYAYGALATEQYTGSSFPTVNAIIERNTGAPRQFTDPAGHVRTMEYDGMSRISTEALPGGLVMKYLYPPMNSTNHATASVTAYASTDLVTPLTRTTYEYDAFGRVDSVFQLMPDPNSPSGSLTHRDTVWNTLGQKLSETEPALVGSSGVTTSYTYDAFGRLTAVLPPDGAAHAASYSYAGTRSTTTTIGAGAGGIGSVLAGGNVVEHPVSKTEEHDAFGRLTKVVESSQNGGLATTATYDYDVLDHVARVTMSAAEGTQNRTFTFDNRGFLVNESQPETGLTVYDKYDVYGHALHKLQGVADGPFDLTFVYDIYQRLAEVRQGASGQTLVKQMTYDTLPAGGPWSPYTENGQLLKSYRRNFHAELGGDVGVNTYFHYDSAGRLDQKTTSIGTGPSFTQGYSYDLLGELMSLHYPNCSTCAPIAGGAVIPDRTIDFRWSHGYLTGVDQGSTHFTSSAPIEYWPNGMMKNIIHVAFDGSHPVTDSQTLDQGMARPGTITFTGATDCPAPSATITAPTAINAFAAGSASVPFSAGSTYAWTINGGTFSSGTNGTNVSFTAGCSGNVSLGVTVTANCGTPASQSVQIPINGSAAPSISSQPLDASVGYGQLAQLTVVASGAGSYQWYRFIDSVNYTPIAGQTSATLQAPNLTATTRFFVRVTSSTCGAYVDSRIATVTVTLATPQSLLASRYSDGSKIVVTWSAVPADHYQIEKRVDNTLSYSDYFGVPPFNDLNVSPGYTYVYRVRAVGSIPATGSADVSSFSNADLSTMMTFTSVGTNTPITYDITQQLLTALNALNRAKGWPQIGWVDILPSNVPAPGHGVRIYAQHVMSIKAAMGAALDALGVVRPPGPNVGTGSPCNHADIQQLQVWAQ
jgi:YD repeat-containing protein